VERKRPGAGSADRLTRPVAARLLRVLAESGPRVKRALPSSLHDIAGRAGRAVVRWLERRSTPRARPDWHRVETPAAADLQQHDRPIVLVTRGLRGGGAERQLVNLLHGLSQRADAPPAVLLDLQPKDEAPFLARKLADANVPVRRVPPETAALAQLAGLCGTDEAARLSASLSWAPPDLRNDILRLVPELLRLRPAVVHGWQDTSGPAAAVAGLAAGVPRVAISTRNLNPTHFGYFRPYMPAVYRRLAAEPGMILTNNSDAGARDYERWLGLHAGRFQVVRNGIDAVELQPPDDAEKAALKARLGLPPGARLVGGMFRLQAEKRPLLWLRAARLVLERRPEAWFAIFGSGPMLGRMRRLAARLGLRHRLVLAGETAEPFAALSLFDVCLLTSRQEGTPNVMLEASLAGVPVVATDVGGTAETVLPGITGLLVADTHGSGSKAADEVLALRIADAVVEALDSESLRRSAAREGPRFVHSVYGLERMIRGTLALYGHVGPSTSLSRCASLI
jgi:glycosyltransferase involved in cell wall biosynthesis